MSITDDGPGMRAGIQYGEGEQAEIDRANTLGSAPKQADRPMTPAEQLSATHTATYEKYAAEAQGGGDARGHLARAVNAAEQAAQRADSFLNDDRIAEAGRKRLAEEVVTAAEADVQAALDAADASIIVSQAQAVQAAKPEPPKSTNAQVARMDARMRLDAAAERGRLDGEIARLAARDDPVGALIGTSWLADYLESRGESPKVIDAYRINADAAALDAAMSGNDPARARAAEKAFALGFGGRPSAARKAHVAAVHATRVKLGRFKTDDGRL